MVFKFNPYRRFVHGLAYLWLVAAVWVPPFGHADLLDDMCGPGEDSTLELKPLVAEAEATGMPPSTLNRLLVKGYQDQSSARELAQLLCVIVLAEEDGLSPDLLFAKLDEGLGKRASLSRISAVIEDKVDDMKFAQRILSDGKEPALEDDNVTRLAKAMSAGLSRQKLNLLFHRYAGGSMEMRVVAAEIMAYGGAAGYDAQLLDQIVKAGLTYEAFSDDWTFLIKLISKSRKKNISDQRLADEAVKTLTRKGSLNDLIAALGMTPSDVY